MTLLTLYCPNDMRIDVRSFTKNFSPRIACLVLLFSLFFTLVPGPVLGDLVQLDFYWGIPAPDHVVVEEWRNGESSSFLWGGLAFDLIFWLVWLSIFAFGIRAWLQKIGLNIRPGFCLIAVWFVTTALYASVMRPDIRINLDTGGFLGFLESRGQQIDMAMEYGDIETLKALFKNHPDLISKPDAGGERPLYKAAYWGQTDIVRLLLADKADVNKARDETVSDTPLLEAADGGWIGATELLIKAGANVNGYDGKNGKETPLMAASRGGHNSVVLLLLANHANVNARINTDGLSALHEAAWYGRGSIVQLLVASNADVNLKANDGETPLFYAMKAVPRNTKTLELLLSHGANPNVVDTNGFTPIRLASDWGDTNLVEMFKRHGALDNRHLKGQ